MEAGTSKLRTLVVDLLAILFITFCLGLASAVEARAEEPELLAPIDNSEPGQGTLLFRSKTRTESCAAPLLHTEVEIKVSGLVARTHVTQTFRNPSDEWFEGVYVFPLPESSAVDRMRIRIGERVIEGEIRERGAAKKRYEAARDSGRRAALLEQERPNIFTSSVANIGPQEDVVVEIEYQQTLRYDAGTFSLRFPMTVGVRYIPGAPLAERSGGGWSPDTVRVADASRITPPVLHPSKGPINPVSIRVELDAGMPLSRVDSPTHRVRLGKDGARRDVVELDDGVTPANRDFELVWTPAVQAAPRAAWFAERRGDRTYGLLMILPPPDAGRERRIPRESIYVIDTSGSMNGTSITQAKEALEFAIDGLAPEDRFNIIEFNSYAKALFREARPATRENRAEARGWVGGLRAQGGTEMALALDLALNGSESGERVRQVVFLTDGQVGNEEELFRLIRAKLGDSRLFTVGIGSAPNSHFMTKAASIGRGTFTYIGKVDEVREKMGALFAKLESPVLKGVKIDWPRGVTAESWPPQVPDLYAGEPVVVTVALDRAAGIARVSGMRGAAPWVETLALDQPARGAGVGALWARDKIGSLEDAAREGASSEETKGRIIEIALAHQLVTKYTSLVAVDHAPARPAGSDLKTAAMPTNLPEGWNYDAVFGAQQGDAAIVGRLPQGATDSELKILTGLISLLLAAVFWMVHARRRHRIASA
jgi:Ca-activated chloride channel family protein